MSITREARPDLLYGSTASLNSIQWDWKQFKFYYKIIIATSEKPGGFDQWIVHVDEEHAKHRIRARVHIEWHGEVWLWNLH